jgi:phage regulator Rha-like protein
METGITKLFNESGEQIITSLDIARLTGKEHKNVLRDIRNMEPAWEKLHQLKFEQMQIREKLPNNGYRLRRVYALTKLECLYIATKYDDVSRAKLVLRWEELERGNVRTQGASPKLLMTEREIVKKGDEIRKEQIEKENAPADGCLTISEIAEMLNTSVKNLNQFLVKQDIQFRRDGRYYLTPKYEGSGFAQERAFHYFSLEGEKKERIYLVWTPLGVEFIRHLYFMNN